MHKKVIVRLDGGLGNQLFEYALARGVADRIGARIVLDVSRYWFNRFRRLDIYAFKGPYNETSRVLNFIYSAVLGFVRMVLGRALPNRIYRRIEACVYRLLHIQVAEANSSWIYDPVFENLKAGSDSNIYIRGIYQYLPVLADVETLRGSFVPIKTLSQSVQDRLSEIRQSESVSVHIRRGDYVSVGAKSMVLPMGYYRSAIQEMSAKLSSKESRFYFFSDDPSWCEKTFADVPDAIFVTGNTASPIDDLLLMMACKHHIIANSTFSFWGAYLGEAKDTITIYPRYWMCDLKTTDTMVPRRWIPVESWKGDEA